MQLLCCVAGDTRGASLMARGPAAAASSTSAVEMGAMVSGGGGASAEADLESERSVPQHDRAEAPFVPLLILSALTVAFAHGANDLGNSIGPLAAILSAVRPTRTLIRTLSVTLATRRHPLSGATARRHHQITACNPHPHPHHHHHPNQVRPGGDITKPPPIPLWLLTLGSTGFVLGIVALGARTITTVRHMRPASTQQASPH